MNNRRTNKILIISTTLGSVRRGFEISANQLFTQLVQYDSFRTFIAQHKITAPPHKNRIRIIHFSRNSIGYKLISKIRSSGYAEFIREISFAIFLTPWIIFNRPSVLYYTEPRLGNYFFHLRKFMPLKYTLLFSNGAPYEPEIYKYRCDHVQQKVQWTYDIALKQKVPSSKMSIIPNGFSISQNAPCPTTIKSEIKDKLNLSGKKIILSVGAINSHHKRIDYIISEVQDYLIKNNAVLICLGELTPESNEIIARFENLIKQGNLQIKTVEEKDVLLYYQIADIFIHGSLFEGFGRSIIEALSFGCRCILHDFEGFREIANKFAVYTDMSVHGNLKKEITDYFDGSLSFHSPEIISKHAISKYDWTTVIPLYIALFSKLCQK